MRTVESRHVPVLAKEALEWLAVREGGVYVDCTAGAGGHSALIAARLGAGRLIAIDRDPLAVALARERLAGFRCAEVHQANYGELNRVLAECFVPAVDGVLIDAGVSSMQLDEEERGFSFQSDGPLDMRMDPSGGVPARVWLAEIEEAELAACLRRYGDVGPARRIAAAIVRRSRAGRMTRTLDLSAAVSEALPHVRGVPEEVRTVFQAVRIAVNEELKELESGLCHAIAALRPGGRLVVITFHSGEDSVAKRILREHARAQRELHADGRVKSVRAAELRLLTAKPVTPGPEETRVNPRSASAKLRAAARLNEEG